jgi:hypothetical protein
VPKSKIAADEPIWDELISQLGDPRPYTATPISDSYREPDDPWIDPEYFDHLLYELAIDGEEAMAEVDAIREVAVVALDQIHAVAPEVIEWYNSVEITTQFAAVGALSDEN